MEKVLVGMSGGVDSAAAALLLKKAGYDVIGCRLTLNKSEKEAEEEKAARSAAERLGIRLIAADFSESFKKEVSDYFISEYLAGRTPNPCVKCNPAVKFASLIKTADENGAGLIATGHYARITKTADGLFAVSASPSKKDQSYFLYRLPQEILRRTLFPLGGFLSKDEIRALARDAGFEAAEKKDSQDICFIPDNDYAGYILRETGKAPVPGNFIDADGKIIGRHSGIINYTVGQRRGLGAFGEPRYVKYINAKDNTVILCKADERFSDTVRINGLFWASGKAPDASKTYGVKIRSTAKAAPAKLIINGDSMTVLFDSPVAAPCPGQSAVVYDGDAVVGGGVVV